MRLAGLSTQASERSFAMTSLVAQHTVAATSSFESVPLSRILILGGFCEPLWLLAPVRSALSGCADSVEVWRDVVVHRELDRSIGRLRDALAQQPSDGGGTAVLSHSFGDWVVRQALADFADPPISALVSVAPLMGVSPIGLLLRTLGCGRIAEVPVMTNAACAARGTRLDPRIRRLVIWAHLDLWVRPVTLLPADNLSVQHYWATHLSIILQPNVHQRIRRFLSPAPSTFAPVAIQVDSIDNSRAISSGFTGLIK